MLRKLPQLFIEVVNPLPVALGRDVPYLFVLPLLLLLRRCYLGSGHVLILVFLILDPVPVEPATLDVITLPNLLLLTLQLPLLLLLLFFLLFLLFLVAEEAQRTTYRSVVNG